jgi:hypothetical protein
MKEKFVILKNLRMSFQKSKNVGLSVYKKNFLEKTKTHKYTMLSLSSLTKINLNLKKKELNFKLILFFEMKN